MIKQKYREHIFYFSLKSSNVLRLKWEIKNYTLAFADLEEDNIYISTKSTPDLNIFKSNAQHQNQK